MYHHQIKLQDVVNSKSYWITLCKIEIFGWLFQVISLDGYWPASLFGIRF